jgi:endonuclease G
MCPSADRTYSSADNRETFLMTNMIPQAPMNNQRTWANLETYERALVDQGNECYIICGAYGIGGTGSKGGTTNTIDAGRVTVPKQVWKVIIVLPQGTNDIARVTTATRVIAINTPNINSINSSWSVYRTSVDAIEAATGYDVLSNLPDAIEAVIEARVDNGPTQ